MQKYVFNNIDTKSADAHNTIQKLVGEKSKEDPPTAGRSMSVGMRLQKFPEYSCT